MYWIRQRRARAQRPSFWIEFESRLGKALLPLAWRYVSRRMPSEEEATWREAEKTGQGDAWLKLGGGKQSPINVYCLSIHIARAVAAQEEYNRRYLLRSSNACGWDA